MWWTCLVFPYVNEHASSLEETMIKATQWSDDDGKPLGFLPVSRRPPLLSYICTHTRLSNELEESLCPMMQDNYEEIRSSYKNDLDSCSYFHSY